MKGSKSEATAHATQYISAVFEATLRENGFACLNDKLLCWYRIKNGEIIESVIFCASNTYLPLDVNMQYESVPAYMPLIKTQNVYYPSTFDDRWDCSCRRGILEGPPTVEANLARYDDTVWVYAPRHGKRGLYTLTDVVLPYFDCVSTVEDCYRSHKETHLNLAPRFKDKMFSNMSRDFVDEILCNGDEELYPYCENVITKKIAMYKKLVLLKPGKKNLSEDLNQWKQLQRAFSEGAREERIHFLNEQKRKNLEYLTKLMC